MDANLIDFYSGTSNAFVDRVTHLIKHWRIGTTANLCKVEADLNVVSMYLYMLERLGGTNYTNITETQITNVIYQTINILNVTNITNIDATQIINNVYNNIVNNYTVVEGSGSLEPFTGSYSGIDTFTVTITHDKNKIEVIVEVYEEDSGELVRVYPEIRVIDANTVELNFTSTSDGKYYIY